MERSVKRVEVVDGVPPSNFTWETQGGPRKVNTPESLLAKCVPVDGGCLLWTGAMTATHEQKGLGVIGQPEACIAGLGHEPVMLRRFFFEWHGGVVPERHRVIMACGEPRCLAFEHMTARRGIRGAKGVAHAERRAEILRLWLEGLDAHRKAKYLNGRQISIRFGLTHERVRQILALELGIELKTLPAWREEYLSKPLEEAGIESPEP